MVDSKKTYFGEGFIPASIQFLSQVAAGEGIGATPDGRLAGEALSRWEAGLLMPQRQDFAQLWRYLEHACSAGPMAAPLEQLLRQATKGLPGRGSYGKALVCFHVMDERGLIRAEFSGRQVTVHLCRPDHKVDLEQAQLMKHLRSLLEL